MIVRKRFGQHFLESAWAAKLVQAIRPQAEDRLIEIGPGRGAITAPLAARVAAVHAIEIDRDLAAVLEQRALPRVHVITGDFLALDLDAVATALMTGAPPTARLRVVGNLPYNISTPILLALVDWSTRGLVHDATLMLQREVADRLLAVPGTGDYGVLTITTALRADVRRVLALPPGAFRPAPKVHSSVVTLTFRPPPPFVSDPALVVALARSVFTQRRKTLANALAGFATSRHRDPRHALAAADIDPTRRPETLSLADFARLADALVH